jgi:AraC family transcriptional regulator of adaptative response / DNA-3-methyladenine glycosylase II
VAELDARVCDRARLARDPRFDGRFFIGVLSTGIYCRPICPSPAARRENVRYFRSAEEAVAAGLRPCLRCRPETVPGTPAWRLHFAKQLISDTDLPMFRVALAAGFRSVRRFNDFIQKLYGRTPSELRRLQPVALRARPGEYVFRLPYHPPYDWDSLLAFLAGRAIPGVEEVVSGVYRRSFAFEGRHGILEVRHEKGLHALEARIRFREPLSLLPIVTRLRALFDLAAETSVIAGHFRRDLLLRRLVRKYPGLRVPGAWDGFELAVRAILGQQVSVAAASTLAGRIAQEFGERLSVADTGGLTLVFPGPEALAGAGLQGMPRARARAIRSLAEAVVSGGVAFSLFGTEETTLAGLARIRGIGEWTAQYIAMRALRQPDAFPSNDLVLLRTAGRGRALTAAALRKRAEQWRPWRAYAALYLWRAAADQARERERSAARPAPGPPRTSRPARALAPGSVAAG